MLTLSTWKSGPTIASKMVQPTTSIHNLSPWVQISAPPLSTHSFTHQLQAVTPNISNVNNNPQMIVTNTLEK